MFVIVCGDSYCSADMSANRQHFSQILTDSYGFKVVNYAQPGCSQIAISFQIKKAIEQRPNVIIYNRTFPDRVEVPIKSKSKFYNRLDDFLYHDAAMENFSNMYNKDSSMASIPLTNLDVLDKTHVDNDTITALQMYTTNLFNWHLKFEIDAWIFDYWSNRIQNNNIVGISLAPETEIGTTLYEFTKNNRDYPTVYHTDSATQQKVADMINKRINRELINNNVFDKS